MRSRGWILTIWEDKVNLPSIQSCIESDDKVQYFIGGHELTPTTNKKHIQGFIYFQNAVTRGGLERRLGLNGGDCHSEAQRGLHSHAAEYSAKDNDVWFEHGTIPDENNQKQSSWDYILEMIENGMSNLEIMRKYPAEFARCRGAIDAFRMEMVLAQLNEWRDVKVHYIWGKTGSGKTRGILEGHTDRSDVFRITDYKHPWDSYRGQSVVMFEEFRSSLPCEKMLIYLDGYICELPSRYNNKASAYETIYIVTNIPFEEQYANIQMNHPETFAAFRRRIDTITELN
jgi:hypothetical protein